MGGLASAALLCELGLKVLVVEQHYEPGGFTHTFKRKKWTWDVGVHAIGETNDKSALGRLLGRLTHHELKWTSLGGVYDSFYFPDLHIDFPDSRDQFRENLLAAFPHDDAVIDAYLEEVRSVGKTMRAYYLSRLLPPRFAPVGDAIFARSAQRYLHERTADVLRRIGASEKLATVLAAQWGYYGSPPERSSFAIHALTAKHFMFGATYPSGGSKNIAATLMKTIASNGGWTRIATPVEEIIVRAGRAVGVRLQSGEEILAGSVISAAGGIATTTRLLPAQWREEGWAKSVSSLAPSPAHLCLNLGFSGDIAAAGATAANQWFYESWKTKEAWAFENRDEEAPVLYCSFPSVKDPAHIGEPTGEIVTFARYEAFDRWRDARWKRRGQDYDQMKTELTERLLAQFFRHRPELKQHLAYAELSTPLSTEHFTRAEKGAIYGIEPTPERYANRYLRPRTPLKGLFMSGGDMASVGVMGAFVGGILCATSAEPRKAMAYLRQ